MKSGVGAGMKEKAEEFVAVGTQVYQASKIRRD